jgi:hypothetical protein
MLFYVLYSENIKLPSENWSRSFIVDEYEATDEVVYNVLFPTVYSNVYNGEIITCYYSQGKIHLKYLDDKLETVKTDEFDVQVNAISDFRGFVVNSNQLVIYINSQNQDALYKYVYDLSLGTLMEASSIETDMRLVTYFENTALIYSNNRLTLWDGTDEQIISEDKRFENIALFKDEDIWNIMTIESTMGSNRMLKHYILDQGEMIVVSDIHALESGSNYKAEELEILLLEDHVKIFSKIYQDKFTQNYINIINYDLKSNQIALEYSYLTQMSMTNSKLIESPIDEIKYIQAYPVSLGMRDISSKDETYYNLFMDTYSESAGLSKKMLTKTVHLSNHPNYFTRGTSDYLQWSEVSKGKNVIMYSTNQPDLIKQSQKLINGEFLDLLWSTFSSNMLMIYFFLFISVSIAFPIILVILPVSLIFFQWSEDNQDKLFNMTIGIHLLSKFYYIFNFLRDHSDVLIRLPGILSNQYFQYGISMSTTIIAYFCLNDFVRKRNITNFLFKYLFFFVIDIILLVLILVPYRML